MLEWVEKVLKPYLVSAPPYVVPLILLNSFKVHMLRSAVEAIQSLGAEVEFIPPGCTGLVQPVDVGFNKPFKAKLRAQFSEWMMRQDPNQATPGSWRQNVKSAMKQSAMHGRRRTSLTFQMSLRNKRIYFYRVQ